MAKGGKRPGAGRKKGSRDAAPRTRKKAVVSKDQINGAIDQYDDTTKPLFLQISKYLTKKNKELYKDLLATHGTTLESLQALRDDLMVRYNYARIAEMEGVETAKNLAKRALKELEEHGTIGGKKIADKDKEKKIIELTGDLSKKPRLSTAVTSLASEIRQVSELIDRIEANRQDLTLNIFNILNGKSNKKQTEDLRNRIFDLPTKADDAEIVEEEK